MLKEILSATGAGAYPSYLTDGEPLSWGVFSIFSQHIEALMCVFEPLREEKLSSRVNNTQPPIASSTVGEMLRVGGGVSWLNSHPSALKELLAIHTHLLKW